MNPKDNTAISYDGAFISCVVYIDNVISDLDKCFAYEGNKSAATVPRKCDCNNKIVVHLAVDINATKEYKIAVKLKNPNAIAVHDIGVTT